MRYIDSWLTGLGLEYIIPKLKANGITTPKKLALLTLRDMYEVVGVEDAEDRKKLYFLIQRLHTILSNKPETLASQDGENDDEDEEGVEEDDEYLDSPKKLPDRKNIRVTKTSGDDSTTVPADGGVGRSAEEDLRVLRRNKRASIEPAPLVPLPPSPKLQIPNSFSDFSEGVPYEIKSARNSRKINQKIDALGDGMQDISLSDKPRRAQQSSRQMQPKKSFRTAVAEESPPSPPPVAPVVRVQSTQGASLASNQTVANRRRPASPPASPPHSPPPPLESQRRGVVPVQPPAKASAIPTNSNNSVKAAARSVPVAPPVRADVIPDVEEQEEDECPIVDMAIRVVVRKRPISRSELAKGDKDVMDIRRGGIVLVNEPKVKVDLTKVVETQAFTFDDAFDATETNEAIYARTIKHLVSFVFDGGKASCFAYGQTGSGKTFSMMGSRPDAPAEATVNAGLYVLAARDIFSYVAQPKFKHIKILVSCFEIYGGKLFDLLNNRGLVKCLEDAKQQVQLPGLTEHQVRNSGELLDLMAMAHTQRSTGSTGANAESSRSHQVMQIVLRDGGAKPVVAGRGGLSSHAPPPPRPPGGKLSFIDLAGSERGADTTHNSKQTRMEGAEINTSLLALKEVIRSLERKHGHTPFRGSKLTQVLKDSFVGDKTRTCMVACVSPSSSNCEHTLNTLRYADRVKEHQSGGPSGVGANVDSHSKYDSMAYDYVPPPPKTSAATAAPVQQNNVVPSAKVPAKSSGASAAAPPSKLQPPSSKFAARGAQDMDEAVQNRPLQRPTPSGRAGDPALQRPMRSQSSSKIPSVSSEQQRQKESINKQQAQAVPSRQPVSRYEDEESNDASQDNGYLSDQEAEAHVPVPVHSAKGSVSGGGKRLSVGRSVGRSVDAQSSRQHYIEAESSSAYEEPPRRGAESVKLSSRAQNDEQLRRQEYEADRREAHYRQSMAAGYAPPDDDEDEDGHVFDGHRRVVAGEESSRRHSQGQRVGRREVAEDNSAYEEEEEEEEEEDDIDEDEDDGTDGADEGNVESTELIQKTVALLSAHKLSIAEMVEVMKEEMELVQDMENVDDRDAELYIDKLDDILAAKGRAVAALRDTLHRFQRYRAGGTVASSSRRTRPPAMMPTSAKKRSEGKNGRL